MDAIETRMKNKSDQLALFDPDACPDRVAERRRMQWSIEILEREPDEIAYLHAGLCLLTLPRSKPKREFQPWDRINGRLGLSIIPGYLPTERGSIPVGLPYGARARLILLYLMTNAVRSRSRVVPLGPSMSAWLRALGLAVTGGERGTIRAVREQALRLSRCTMTLRFNDADGSIAIKDRRLVEGLTLWATDEGQSFPTEVELDQTFFEHLCEHAVPLDERAISKLKGSALALDLYAWLAHRLPRLERPLRLSWPQLQGQFGIEEGSPRKLGQMIRHTLREVLAVYPEARVDIIAGGVVLHNATPVVKPRRGLLRGV
jgi:hypothetical protein